MSNIDTARTTVVAVPIVNQVAEDKIISVLPPQPPGAVSHIKES